MVGRVYSLALEPLKSRWNLGFAELIFTLIFEINFLLLPTFGEPDAELYMFSDI